MCPCSVPCSPRTRSSTNGRCVANSPVADVVTSAPSGCASMKACITGTSRSAKLGGMYTRVRSARSDGLHARVAQISRRHRRKVGERHLGLLDLGMPPLLPLEAVEALVPGAGQCLDLPLHRHLAAPRQHVLAIGSRGHRVLEVRVPDPLP